LGSEEQKLKLYIKFFVFMGVPFGLLMGLIAGLVEGILAGILAGGVSGLCFGFFMSLILVTHQRSITKDMNFGDFVRPRQTREISLGLRRDDAFNRCLESLNHVGATVTDEDRAQGQIKAQFGATRKSFGEIIGIQVSGQNPQTTDVKVSSSPKLKTTLTDYVRDSKMWSELYRP